MKLGIVVEHLLSSFFVSDAGKLLFEFGCVQVVLDKFGDNGFVGNEVD